MNAIISRASGPAGYEKYLDLHTRYTCSKTSKNQKCVVALVSSSGERNNKAQVGSQVVALYAHTVITILMKN